MVPVLLTLSQSFCPVTGYLHKFLSWPLKVQFASYLHSPKMCLFGLRHVIALGFTMFFMVLLFTSEMGTLAANDHETGHLLRNTNQLYDQCPFGDSRNFRQLEEMSCSSTCTLAAVLKWACEQLESNHWICLQKKCCCFRTSDFINRSLLIVTNSCWCHWSKRT